jgi:hypothetical protein
MLQYYPIVLSPIVMVLKNGGNWCMCIDLCALNEFTIKEKKIVPVINDLLDEIHSAKLFTKLDLHSN